MRAPPHRKSITISYLYFAIMCGRYIVVTKVKEIEKKFGVKVEDIKKGNFRGLKEEMSDIEKIKKRNSVKFNIDEILDRISSVGIENLTPEERNFLDNYNNE